MWCNLHDHHSRTFASCRESIASLCLAPKEYTVISFAYSLSVHILFVFVWTWIWTLWPFRTYALDCSAIKTELHLSSYLRYFQRHSWCAEGHFVSVYDLSEIFFFASWQRVQCKSLQSQRGVWHLTFSCLKVIKIWYLTLKVTKWWLSIR